MSSTLTKVYNQNNYTIAASDIVLKNYKVTIEVDKTLNPSLDVKLNSAIEPIIGKDGLGSLTFKKVSDGKFEAVANEDVVAAVLFKTPPPIQNRGADVSEWKNADVNLNEIKNLENYLAKSKPN